MISPLAGVPMYRDRKKGFTDNNMTGSVLLDIVQYLKRMIKRWLSHAEKSEYTHFDDTPSSSCESRTEPFLPPHRKSVNTASIIRTS